MESIKPMEQPSTESLSKKVVRGGLWVFALRITSRSLGFDIVWHDADYEGEDIVTGTWRWAGNSTNLGTLFFGKRHRTLDKITANKISKQANVTPLLTKQYR